MRKPMVTRTLTNTHATVLGMNLETAQSEVKEVVVPRTYKSEDKLLKAVSSSLDSETFKAVKVTSFKEVETRYGMSEEDFIKYAKEMPLLGEKEEAETEAE